ncbi:MAG: hypothetical protein IT578_10330 [Verrucomicrobiae bacterium]|nr:hypothetical protein [Verrucomicrobiae bacterium]
MKNPHWIPAVVLLFALLSFGCGKKEVDTSRLEKSFAPAQAEVKADVDQAVRLVKSGDYAGALSSLQQAATQAQLTSEQEAAIRDVIAQVQERLSQAVKKAAGDAHHALDDLQKSLPK